MAATDAVNNTAPSGTWYENSNAKPKPAADSDTLANKDTFLKLLVAQMKNQNPLNPADGVQFVSQLAQFSNLEQNIQMREDLASIRKAIEQYIDTQKNTETQKG